MNSSSQKEKCFHCNANLDPALMPGHLVKCEASRPYPCDICNRRFTAQASVKTHKSRYHTGAERKTRFMCSYCEHGSDNKEALQKHMRQHKEEGGPGFRSRSRSRSRAPESHNRSQSRQFEGNGNNRGNSQLPFDTNNYNNRRSKSNSRAISKSISWADVPPTKEVVENAVRKTAKDTAGSSSAFPDSTSLPITKDGVIKLAMIDPEAARRIMKVHKMRLYTTIQRLREHNQATRNLCKKNGISLNEDDIIAKQLAKCEEIYRTL